MKFRPASGLLRSAGLALVLAPLLSACGDDPAPALEEGEREASEEVLEGTISDAMLPLDQVRSQAPLAEPEAEEGDESDEEADADAEAESE